MARPRKEEIIVQPLIPHKTIRGVIAVALVVCAILLMLAAAGMAGMAGQYAFTGLYYAVGVGYFLLPLLLLFVIWAVVLREPDERTVGPLKAVGAAALLVAVLGLIELFFADRGGVLGQLVASPLVSLMDVYATVVLLLGVAVAGLVVMFDTELHLGLLRRVRSIFVRDTEEDALAEGEELMLEPEEDDDEPEEEEEEEEHADERDEAPAEERAGGLATGLGSFFPFGRRDSGEDEYTPPPISLLEKDKGKASVGDTKANTNIIKRTLANFGIRVEMDEVTVGPSVTRYAMKPAEGVRLNKILGLQSNLEMALAAGTIRIEAPIPGKSLVGIEVPNSTKSTVGLSALLSTPEFKESPKPLLITLGKDITGTPHYADISKMPHGLIAGTTGSGKSVTIHSLITSLLYRHGPDHVRFLMVDPKRVELTVYNSIPHLLNPVITDAKQAILALKWAGKEMERRLNLFEENQVRDIGSYLQNVVLPAQQKYKKRVEREGEDVERDFPDRLPYIVIIIDELADIMQAYPRELESAIVRIAQKSRATGIHLVLSTQRPSVNVITGLIKANVPTRVALQVSSQIDSRTILDQGGAEKLLGAGDMLYLSSEMGKPRRLQSPFISEKEVKSIVDFIAKKNDYGPEAGIGLTEPQDGVGAGPLFESGDFGDGDDDDLYEDAREIVTRAGKASTSYLQRKLSVGYARAAKLIDLLEERGVVGPSNGSKARDVIGAESTSDDE